ncbi:TetR/AcrR family transcriptional regulator C-terminal domain-containing protein [Nonomuraea sp. NPDC049725]|uniref:TetR/AcrR family transcriptional regulator C-terminal domain-containing protein n=1 Tax=Nonomuraea sp. NPDC049725 TaxID=3154508 RepID=UPI0034230356
MGENRRGALSPQVLVETALRLLDEVGLDGLTVRRLAAELGVRSPALYWHIRTKQELLDGMADAIVLAAGMGPPSADETWQEWLARRARAYRRCLLAHRDSARIVAGATRLGAETVARFDEELAELVRRGFGPVLALRAITHVTHYVNGFVLQEQAERPESGQPAGPPGETLAAALREGGSPLGEEAFEHGLRTLVAGIEADIEAGLEAGGQR